MNDLKALKGTAVALAVMALAGCAQPYTPAPEEHLAGPRGAGDVFNSNPDAAEYQTVRYEVLRSWLVDTLHMPQTIAVSGVCDPVIDLNQCPVQAPVQYLDANKGALGVAVFTADPDGTPAPSMMNSGGFKVWIVGASSAPARRVVSPRRPRAR